MTKTNYNMAQSRNQVSDFMDFCRTRAALIHYHSTVEAAKARIRIAHNSKVECYEYTQDHPEAIY